MFLNFLPFWHSKNIILGFFKAKSISQRTAYNFTINGKHSSHNIKNTNKNKKAWIAYDIKLSVLYSITQQIAIVSRLEIYLQVFMKFLATEILELSNEIRLGCCIIFLSDSSHGLFLMGFKKALLMD